MSRIWILVVCASAALGQTLIQTDFGGQWAPVSNNPRGSGELPRGWADNSNWADLKIHHERKDEDGAPFLRSTVSALETGWGQLQHNLPRVTESAYYRLRMRARSADELNASAGIRRSGSPYNYLWQMTIAPGARWRDYVFYTKLSPAEYDVGFYIAINGAGSFDLSVFQLDKLSERQLLDELARNAGDLPKNLLRNTRFPLGLPAGWVLDRESSDEDVVQVSAEGNALHVTGAKPWTITSEPFAAPKPKASYTASFTARGSAAGRLVLIADGSGIATRNFRATPEPQRLSVTFAAPLLGRAQALRIEGTGELWMEDFQLEEGASATAFTPPACELQFGTPSPIRAAFDAESLELRYATLGGESCAKVRLRAENLAGEESELAADGLSGVTELPAAFGAYRVEGWVEGEDGARLSPYQEMTLYRLRRPRYWMRDAPDSPFGVHTNSTTRHILMAKAAGINWTRLHDAGLQYIGWYHLERKPGEWTFYDDDIRRYRRYGLKVLGLLSTAPEWASYFDKARNGYYDRFYQPRDLEQFANYVRTVTKRYRGAIDTWDVWNEPWNAGWWAVAYDEIEKKYVTSAKPQADFVSLQRKAAETAKQVDPSLTVLGANSTTGSTGTAWTTGIVAAGGLQTSDVLCYHQYTTEPLGFANDAVARGWRDAMGPARTESGLAKPVWMTEGSPVHSLSGAGFYKRILPFSDTENFSLTSDRIARYVVALLAENVRKVFLYSMHSHDSLAGAENPWRVIVGRDGYLHPNAAAHSALAWLLEDKRFVSRLDPSPSVTICLFEGPDGSVAVVAPRPGAAPDWTPPALARLDLYGNPVADGVPRGRTVSYLVHEGDAASLTNSLTVLNTRVQTRGARPASIQ
ncbi:MAG: hypothetical protein HY822_18795 [Acidobacteria bacterium]|nr:hypothetical protein [Acidobacteriota bacterium]